MGYENYLTENYTISYIVYMYNELLKELYESDSHNLAAVSVMNIDGTNVYAYSYLDDEGAIFIEQTTILSRAIDFELIFDNLDLLEGKDIDLKGCREL